MNIHFKQGGAENRAIRPWRWIKPALLIVLTLLVVAGLRPAVVGAAALTIVVDRTDDAPAAQACTAAANDCSLRGAVLKANGDPANSYTITFTGDNTYTLNQDNETPDDATIRDLDILVSLTIDGQGPLNTTISAGDAFRAIHIHPSAFVEIKDLLIRDGIEQDERGGAGILNEGSHLAIHNVVIEQNASSLAGGGIANYGTYLSIEDSELFLNSSADDNNGANVSTECGGAIYHEGAGTVVVARTLIDTNSAQWGGGGICQFGGELVVRDSGFYANTATGAAVGDTGGGAIYTQDGTGSTTTVVRSLFEANSSKSGGAIRSNSPSFWITNSTFAGNTAENGGAIGARTGAMTVVNSTFAGNLASATQQTMLAETAQGGSLTVRNSILWTPDDNGSSIDCAGVTDGGGNVQWYGASDTGFSGACPGTAGFPELGPLQDNGGYTWTMAPEYFSPAVDAGLLAYCPVADQTGRMRDNNGNCDSGAYDRETTANAAPTTNLTGNTLVLTYD